MFSNYSSPQQVIIIVGCCVLVCATWQIICTIHLTIMSPPHRLFVRPRKCKFSQHRFTARCLKSCRNHQTYPLRFSYAELNSHSSIPLTIQFMFFWIFPLPRRRRLTLSRSHLGTNRQSNSDQPPSPYSWNREIIQWQIISSFPIDLKSTEKINFAVFVFLIFWLAHAKGERAESQKIK